ncbi:hypothetical protein BFF78_11780 [Streptomyces fodineus]|uniref:Uncharacterized protein n=1 Tax=Streptomyces fodineus TaxID=1904616 RepID=A0A1D7Y843_9ACTN|nr:hypothetical protein [Streptomyces fodineus]AOR31640.1 hypothetical protein BFF78_11780 [Streptomyces fodineus]
MSLSAGLACLIVLIFALPGVAKIMALGPMPEPAAHAGFTPAAYRLIGALEPAGNPCGAHHRGDEFWRPVSLALHAGDRGP